MLRHLIIEGPDGSGKDTLIDTLLSYKRWSEPLTRHERASTSLGGPVNDLAAWVSHDVKTMHDQPPSVYNRHPLVSEPIYGRYRTNDKPTPAEFDNRTWRYAMKREAAQHAILILCRPPSEIVEAVIRSQGASAHMPGVAENIRRIYDDYRTVVWPGSMLVYDWTSQTPAHLIARITQTIKFSKKASV